MAYRYLGNKTRLLNEIISVVDAVVEPGAVVADLMCGTASVSSALADAGYSVVAADELTFPVLHARARLCSTAPAFAGLGRGGYGEAQRRLNALAPDAGLFLREYSDAGEPVNGARPRQYFTAANAGRIDAMRLQIAEWRQTAVLGDEEADLLLHDLVLATNRVANIAGTYGFYRSKWNAAALAPLELRPTIFTATEGDHEVRQGRVEDVAADITADVIYLDPPYTKRQYAGNYHILETIAREDHPEPVGEGGLRDWYDQYSAFCSRRTVRKVFDEVLGKACAPIVLISYSEDGLVPHDELHCLLSSYGRVRRHEFELPRFTSNIRSRPPLKEHLYELTLTEAPVQTALL